MVYVLVALVNYSTVQSLIGAAAGDYFSKEWGGEVKIGSLHAMPFDHLLLDNILLVSPENDTILKAETLRVRFKRFPFTGDCIDVNSVYLRNAYYHLESYGKEINLRYIINHYKKERRERKEVKPFTVKVKSLILSHVHYKMDLPDVRKVVYEEGVEIPHMEFFDIRGKVKNLTVVNDDIRCRVVRMSTIERSGFEVKDVSGDVHVNREEICAMDMEVETGGSRILADVLISYNGWGGMKDYVHDVEHRVAVKRGTTVAMSDVAYWAPVLWGVDAQIEAECRAEGTISGLKVEELSAHWGRNSGLLMNGEMLGLPVIDSCRIVAEVSRLWTDAKDVESLGIVRNREVMGGAKYAKVEIAERILKQVGYVDLTMDADVGMHGNSMVNLGLTTRLGGVKVDCGVIPQGERYDFRVEANSDGIGLSLLKNEWLSYSGFALSASGRVRDLKDVRGIDGEVEGTLLNSVVRGNRIAPAHIEGSIREGIVELQAMVADSLVDIAVELAANLADSVHQYSADVDVRQLYIAPFTQKDADGKGDKIQANIAFAAEGNDIESLSGEVVAKYVGVGDVKVDDIRVLVENYGKDEYLYGKDYKSIRLESDVVDGVLSGHFRYDEIGMIVRHLCQNVLPEEFNPLPPIDSSEMRGLEDRTVAFSVRWNDRRGVLTAMVPMLSIAPNTRLDGNYNYGEWLKLAMRSDSVRIGSVVLENMGLSGRKSDGSYLVDIEAQSMLIGKMEIFELANIVLNSNAQRTMVGLKWGEEGYASHGDLMVRLKGKEIDVVKPTFYIGEDPWNLTAGRLVVENEGGFAIEGQDITLEGGSQLLTAQISLKNQENDFLELRMNHFRLDKICDIVLQESPIAVKGDIGGRFSMYGLSGDPYFNANVSIEDCYVNEQPIGLLSVKSNWNAELNILNLHVDGEPLKVNGWIGLGQDDPDLNFNASVDGLNLKIIEPLMASISHDISGRLSGDIDISGTVDNPLIMGEAYLEKAMLRLDMTNVAYSIDDTVRLYPGRIEMDSMRVEDQMGNYAVVDGAIRYQTLQEIVLDLEAETDNLMVLNQRSGEMYYGTVWASAEGRIKGALDKLNISVRARTNPGSNLTVPVSNQKQVKEQSYITFASDSPTANNRQISAQTRRTDLNLELDLAITPDVQLNLPMDFAEATAMVGASGNGDVHLTIDGHGEPQVMGNYEFTSGTMKVSILSLLEKTFSIESGSNINFQGSLPDARFDLRAIYSQRVNLSTLTGSLSTVDNTQKYIQVEDVIGISGTVQEPTIAFDIRLPNADQSVSDEVFAYIDRNSERDMLNQTMSLLLMGSFYNANGDGGNLIDNGLSSGYSLVASKLGSAVSDMVQFVDVDFSYKAATDLTKEQLDLNISKDWGRWYLESTLGYGGESQELEASRLNGAVIDALIGYRISPLVHLYAYNRTNTNDYTRIDLPYKQGAGLKLTKDFDTWGELFRRKNKKKDKK